ncbi:hypothetical protein PPL_07620 [Heterostelium album PN500]|uniref:Uncharacterized protein n=1 Tax=Heterostelium pallidum (strain ATCC 26659 / Pp 5 / PN500) TaxID=670386 RepID=D3BGG9_HETP5|nr:hypothetical protein PPL_07620 [Heterostelium album PN500]EFA79569.1 hypothetical protein PPL_07620 [Heterostelium album PN500]|eukprot:XP_020431690.1 hypothetical protein PPL_07620 [Heterostelium album PN500]
MIDKIQQFYSVNTTTGELIKNVNMGVSNKYSIQTILSGDGSDSFLLLATDKVAKNDVILEYSISDNTFFQLNNVNGFYNGVSAPQQYAYDPVKNFVALASFLPGPPSSNLTINIWDFNKKEISSVELPTGPMNVNSIYPVGSYDPTTGNYYIIYSSNVNKSGTYFIVYNLWSNTVVKGPSYFAGFLMEVPQIVYTDDQIYFIDMCIPCSFEIYSVDVSSQSVSKIYTVQTGSNNPFLTSVFGVKGSSIVLFAPVGPSLYETTVIDLARSQKYTSPSVTITTQFHYEWISAGI